jgi:hypothetical protein
MDELLKDEQGLVRTGEFTSVNPNFISEQGLAQARQFASITSETLAGGEQLMDVPEITQGTAASSLSATSSAVGADQKQRTQLERETARVEAEAQRRVDEQEAKVRGLQEHVLGTSEERARLQEEQNIAGKTQKVTDLTNQLEALERAEVNELRALENVGLTPIQRQQRQSEINRRFAFQKADVALLQSAANRDLLTAQLVIDSRINAILEPLKLQLEFETAFLERNFDLLDKADQRAFQARITADEREFDRVKAFEEQRAALLKSAVSQGAPASVIRGISGAKNVNEATIAAGEYAGDILARRIQQFKLSEARLNNLVARAEAGDQSAIDELGFDPKNPPMSVNDMVNIKKTDIKLSSDLETIRGLRQNSTAINLSAGVLQGGDPTAGGFLGIGKLKSGAAAFFETGGGYFPAQVIRQDFLNEVKFLTGEYTLQNLINKKAEGATFGALSNAELGILSASASKLNSILESDPVTGVVTGITGSESNLRKALEEFETITQQAIDLNNSRLLSEEDKQEIFNLP